MYARVLFPTSNVMGCGSVNIDGESGLGRNRAWSLMIPCCRIPPRVKQVKCLSLDRTRFFQLLGPIQTLLQNNMRLRILKGVPLLSKLTNEELCRVADAL